MGTCASRPPPPPLPETAKVVLHGGELREYSHPVGAAHVIGVKDAAEWFLCDADAMDFGDPIAAIADGDDLLPGQLYFVLRASMRGKPLQPDQLAALANKASAALASASADKRRRCRRRAVAPQPLVFAAPPPPPGKGSGGKGRAATLAAIPE